MKRHALLAMNSVVVSSAWWVSGRRWSASITYRRIFFLEPKAVAGALRDRFPSLVNSLLITTEEAAGGLVASIVAGVAVSMIFAQWRWLRQLLYPYTILLQTVPIVAIAPLIIMWAARDSFGHDRNVHHLPGAHYCQYNSRPDQRG